MKRRVILVGTILAANISLVACGGGGESSTAPVNSSGNGTTQTTSTTGSHSVQSGAALMSKTTITYSAPDRKTALGLVSTITTASPVVTSAALGNINLMINEGGQTATKSIASNGIVATGIASFNSGTESIKLGGTTYAYSRFGLVNFINLHATDSTKTEERAAPFHVSTVYSNYAPVTAIYTGKLVGAFVVNDSSTNYGLMCDVSVAYTVGATTVIQPTISNCFDSEAGVKIVSGGIQFTKTVNSVSLINVGLSFKNSQGVVMTATVVRAFNTLIGGPNGEELVGSASIDGVATINGTAANGTIVFSFGGKK